MFTDIDKTLADGQNMGGIAQVVYFGLHSEVSAWPTKPTGAATFALNGALTGDLVMAAGKKLYELYITDDTGEFRIEPVGEKDGKSFVLHLNLFHPGLHEAILGFINASKNENLVFIVPDNNGAKFIMGDALRPATFEGPGDGQGTGKETAARRGIGMEFTYKTANVYQYKGNVPLTEASSA
jgi:hypothetical protein